jgi:hypothetical protein
MAHPGRAVVGQKGLVAMAGVSAGRTFEEVLREEGTQQGGAKTKRRPADEEQPLDPMLTQSTLWSPPAASALSPASAQAAAVEAQARTSLEDLLPALVRRIAWSGDSRRGTMRLELAAGALSGATLVVHADDGKVRVQLQAPEGVDPAAWRARIEGRLAAKGINVEGVEVE